MRDLRKPEDIDYIQCARHLAPLASIDTRITAIQRVFGAQHAYKMNISSAKSMTGLLGALPEAIEAIAGILSHST